MNKKILTAITLFAVLTANASGPASTSGKKIFKQVNKAQGSPNLAGLGNPSTVKQATTFRSAGLIQSLASNYNPSSIAAIKFSNEQKEPIFFSSKTIVSAEEINTAAEAQAVAAQFLDSYKPLLNVKNPSNEFTVKSFEKDELGFTHIRMAQTYMGVTVWGKELLVHFSTKGSTVNGRWIATPVLPALISPVTTSAAINVAVADAKPAVMSNAANQLLKYTGPSAELVLYPKDAHNIADRWAYRVVLRTDFVNMYEYFIDAATGAVIYKDNISCTTGPATTTLTDLNGTARTINTYNDGSQYYMLDITRPMFNANQSQLPNNPVGAIWTVDANYSDASSIQVQQLTSPDDNTWTSSATAASAAYNGTTAYTYYLNTHGRNSIDGNGGNIISVINVNYNGQPMDNAFWNGELMAYGNGQTYFKPLAGGLDVAGHEMTHGVIQSTANLQYHDQSGALNESMADVFGVLISGSDYKIGETVTKSAFNSTQILRDLRDPHNGTTQGNNGWQPELMSEYVNTTSDNGGVHTNSGITNHAFYLFSTAVTKAKAEKVYYRALTKYLTTTSQFLDARLALVQATSDLYGATEINALKSAFDQVGIQDGSPTNHPDTAAVIGTDWIIYQNTDNSINNKLYMIPANTTLSSADYHPLTTTEPLNRVSVTDDGSIAYFVGTDHNVYSITASISNPVQTTLINTGQWDFVSVSRDGNKLALISNRQDTSIYIYDISHNLYKTYHLYSPTFSQGIYTDGPIYAGSIDWDPSSQYVIYDEYNQVQSNDGTDISYWDVALMKVWDNASNSLDSGQISKLVNSLPEGINIGNPVYSKNHSNVVGFDLLTDSTGAFDARGADLNTGALGTYLTGNSVANLPSFSGADDQITFTYQDAQSNYLIGTIPLAGDVIDANGNVNQLVTNAERSVWFRIGHRSVGINDVAVNDVKVYPVPAADKLVISMNDNAAYTNIELTDIMGRVVMVQAITTKTIQLNVNNLQAGIYIIRLKDDAGSRVYTSRIVKE